MADYKQASLSESHFAASRSGNERVVLTWKDINYQIVIKDKEKSSIVKPAYKTKHILNGLSGCVESGNLLAILGPTGCGKTSLMNVLAARMPTGGSSYFSLSGNIEVNGKSRNEEKFRRISAYVLQDDHLYAHLTVFETLIIAAHFFLPDSYTDAEKTSIVDSIISELGLMKVHDTRVGNEKVRGVSGGERKRASIAVQLLSDPAVLFLDEPTSGLDAFQSQAVMESMKNLANNNRLVITVIHQPRSSIFEMFDKLLILSEGRTMYFGDAQDRAVAYFSKLGHVCPDVFNPADYFLDLLSPDNRTPESQESTSNRISYIGDSWLTSDELKALEVEVESKKYPAVDDVKMIGTEKSFKKLTRNTLLLFWRTMMEQWRNIPALMIKMILTLFFALIIGGIYSNIGHSQRSIQNRIGVLFFVVINQTFPAYLGVLQSFPNEKYIVNRERSGQAYNTLSYFAAKVLVEIPLNVMPVIVYCCIIYKLIKLNPDHFGLFILILMLHNLIAVSLGLAVSAAAPSADAAAGVGTPLLIIGILFGGFYISVSALPIVANWIPYVSLFRWTFQALCINEFDGLTFDCPSGSSTCIETGEEVLQSIGFKHSLRYAVFGMGMLLIGFLVLGFIVLSLSGMKFINLGHKGHNFTKYHHNADEPIIESTEKVLENTSSKKAVSPKRQSVFVDLSHAYPNQGDALNGSHDDADVDEKKLNESSKNSLESVKVTRLSQRFANV
eukprot:gene6015-8285_t